MDHYESDGKNHNYYFIDILLPQYLPTLNLDSDIVKVNT